MGPRRTGAAETWLGLQGSTPGRPRGPALVSTPPDVCPSLPGPASGLWSVAAPPPTQDRGMSRLPSWLLAFPKQDEVGIF